MLQWQMRWSELRERFEAHQEMGLETPLDYEPELAVWLLPAYDAWAKLSRLRDQGYSGPAKVPLTAMIAMFDLLGLEKDERYEWLEFFTALEEAFMARVREQRDEERGVDGPADPGG